ncbi:MAG: PAC2 family protein [Candidatus Omnitrophica bacterium]|nr:PAC2 family protein [Candidatus Omnitrophota bacterium]
MEILKIKRRVRLKKPYLVVAWPGMGDVAFKAANYLVEYLKAEELASIEAEGFFYLTGSVIASGILESPQLPESKFYFWKNKGGKNDLIIFLSNAQPDLSKADKYSQEILGLARKFQVEAVVSFASMPQPTDHMQDSAVWFAATDRKIKEILGKYNFRALENGQISGMNGLFLAMAKKAGFKGFCLLGDIPLYTIQIENPKASAAVLEALGKILNIVIDVRPLKEQAHVMENEINKLLDFLKLGTPGQSGPIGEDEVELIKKTLSQLTKLPASIKEKIEKLFEESKSNIAKANELKAQLDKWNVYKEYEDRFLDLFHKNQDKGN